MGTYNIHAGHNPAGKTACGAVGLLDESAEDRLICKEVVKLLKNNGHTAYNCTCNNGTSPNDVLKKICTKCNKHKVDLDVSIHLNFGRNDKKGDNKIGGSEVWCTESSGIKKEVGNKVLKNMAALGFTNRGIKTTGGLYYLNHTTNKAILIEVCFVDDKDDYALYNKVGYKKVAKAIAEGICGTTVTQTAEKYTVVKKTSGKTAIKWMQRKLKSLVDANLEVDGIWGPKTQTALESYWKKLGWKKGSYAGVKTCRALYKNRIK